MFSITAYWQDDMSGRPFRHRTVRGVLGAGRQHQYNPDLTILRQLLIVIPHFSLRSAFHCRMHNKKLTVDAGGALVMPILRRGKYHFLDLDVMAIGSVVEVEILRCTYARE